MIIVIVEKNFTIVILFMEYEKYTKSCGVIRELQFSNVKLFLHLIVNSQTTALGVK